MRWPSPHDPQTRATVEAMIRAGDLSSETIAARGGVPLSTVHSWKRRIVRPKRAGAKPDPLDPGGWPARRRKAVLRLLGEPGVDPCDVAGALGGRRDAAASLRRALGLGNEPRRSAKSRAVPSVGDLNAALRSHIARQIAALDAQLDVDEPARDSGKVLRDLGGLKRLLDELAEETRTDRDGEADGEPEEDLAVLRARIARRYAAFAPDWAERSLCGEPAAAPPEDARP